MEEESESADEIFEAFETQLNELINMMCVASVPDTQQTEIIRHLTTILKIVNRFTIAQIQTHPSITAIETTNLSFHQIYNSISKTSSTYLRHKNNQQLKTYVPPVETAIGIRNEIVNSQSLHKPSYEKLVQSTFQYVPILTTLKTLFASPSFNKQYFSKKNHECTEGIYEDICCGSNIRNNTLFNENPDAVQIELYYDEVEPADPLKSCNGVHKLGQIYMRIRNLPKSFQAKWDQIYLVASFYYQDLHGVYFLVFYMLF